ncbi:MAG: GNAT family N-acetyltransferase [Labilithrix sp.]|nr:GNAT family N-acetyltransferase [Labilithrix sp.]MCW5812215.1 GNAT family N-acetyltransferase [Labilithrix sp.]
MTLRIREATRDDFPAYVRLFVELAIDDDPGDAEKFAREMMPTTLLAERDGAAVGYAFYRVLDGNAHLGHLVSAPEARRTGVGRALIAETVRRATALGAKEIALNVKPANANAIALYTSAGFVARETVTHLRAEWSVLDRLGPADFALAGEARSFDPALDAAFEARFDLPRGLFEGQRRRGSYTLLAIGERAVAAFDPTFPGAYPFRAVDGAHARALLAALRPYARPDKPFLNVSPGTSAEIVDALLALGATVRFQTTKMVRRLDP